MDKLIETIKAGLKSFENDPADSDHQRGYEACLKELARVAGIPLKDGIDVVS